MQGLLSREGRNGGKRRGGKGEPPHQAVLRSAAFYRLHAELSAPDAPHSLLAHTLAASSTGDISALQNLLKTLPLFAAIFWTFETVS